MREFLLAYLAILVTPGPNLLVIAGVAALRGLRGALPICLGIALGAGTLNAALAATLHGAPAAGGWAANGHIAAAGLLLLAAFAIARSRPPVAGRRVVPAGVFAAEFGAGFCTAVTHPMTAALFAAQFLGPLALLDARLPLVPLAVTVTAFATSLGLAIRRAQPACPRLALAWHRPIRLLAAATLVAMAASVLARA